MKKVNTKFKDLFIVNTKVFKDNRGWLKEEFKKKFIKKFSFYTGVKFKKCVAWNYANKKTSDKFLSVLKGKVLDIAVDLKKFKNIWKTFQNYSK